MKTKSKKTILSISIIVISIISIYGIYNKYFNIKNIQEITYYENDLENTDLNFGIDVALEELSIGSSNAPITIIEYASMTCSHCADFHNNIFPIIETSIYRDEHLEILKNNFLE